MKEQTFVAREFEIFGGLDVDMSSFFSVRQNRLAK